MTSNDKDTVRITREQLYDLVWQSPIRTLSQQFGISDVGLAKICKKMKIPVPARGHWAKKAAGKKAMQVPLPVLSASDSSTLRETTFHPALAGAGQPPVAAPIAEQLAFESQPENRITVPETLRSAHPLVRATLDALEGSTKAAGEYVGNWRVCHLDVDVTKASLRRALRIVDALIKAIEHRGWKVTLGTGDDRKSYVEVLGQKVPFGIREPRKQIPNEPPKPVRLRTGKMYTPYHYKYREEPSGRLALVIRNSWGHGVSKSWLETESRPLEDRLNDFIVVVVRVAHKEAERERRWREEKERQRAIEQLRIAEQRQRELEAARGKALEEQAERWRRSRAIQEYLAAIREVAEDAPGGIATGSELAEWLDWAETYSRSLDPLGGPLQDLMRVPQQRRPY